jgi:hemolysin activation/secretion protein
MRLSIRATDRLGRVLAGACLFSAGAAYAQQATTLDQQEQRDRAQREAEAREARQAAPDVRLGGARHADFKRTDLPVEATCFRIGRVDLAGEHAAAFAFAQRYLDGYAGRCIGRAGIDLIVRRTSDLILDRGYVTTRIGVAPQDLARGTLALALVAGTIARVRYADDTPAGNWRTALPSRPGDLLNLRDIEQAKAALRWTEQKDDPAKLHGHPGARVGLGSARLDDAHHVLHMGDAGVEGQFGVAVVVVWKAVSAHAVGKSSVRIADMD